MQVPPLAFSSPSSCSKAAEREPERGGTGAVSPDLVVDLLSVGSLADGEAEADEGEEEGGRWRRLCGSSQ